MMMGETQIAYLMLFTAPGMFAVNMLVARWMANEAPPVALAFWRWFGVLLLMICCGEISFGRTGILSWENGRTSWF